MFAEFSRDLGEHFMLVLEFDRENAARMLFNHSARYFNSFFFCHSPPILLQPAPIGTAGYGHTPLVHPFGLSGLRRAICVARRHADQIPTQSSHLSVADHGRAGKHGASICHGASILKQSRARKGAVLSCRTRIPTAAPTLAAAALFQRSRRASGGSHTNAPTFRA